MQNTNLRQQLETVEAQLAKTPGSLELQFERAMLLTSLEQIPQAKQRYIEILKQNPMHCGALNNLAILLYEAGIPNVARTLFIEALKYHPEEPLLHVNFADQLLYAGEFPEAQAHFETTLRLDSENIHAHQGLSLLFQQTGDEEKMQYHRMKGAGNQRSKTFSYGGDAEPIPLLVLSSAIGGGDISWLKLVDCNVFLVTNLTAAFYDPVVPLPPHHVIFNAIGDADCCQPDLEAAEALLKHTTAPVINSPAAVLATGRITNADRLRHLPGVITARHEILNHDALESVSLEFPFLLRSPGFHTGQHFVWVDNIDALKSAASTLPGKYLMALEYLDARGSDGFVRKYRVMMIDGKLYPLHLAISKDWKVHYFKAEMTDKTEEAEFLNDMPKVLGEKGMAALYSIQKTLGLDYGGVDFGINATGDLLVFEANAVMNIIAPDADYRRAAFNNAISAVHNMLLSKAEVKIQ